MQEYYNRLTCRNCESKNLTSILNLGNVPLAGDFVFEKQLPSINSYPLELVVCDSCGLGQIPCVIDSEVLFQNYRYRSSTTTSLNEHFEELAVWLQKKLIETGNPAGSILEFGSNDGILIKKLLARNVSCLGIDAAENVVKEAINASLPIRHGLFGRKLAETLMISHGEIDVITCSNVFAHIDDIKDVLDGVKTLLSSDGFFVTEIHAFDELISGKQFDTVYHEHMTYYSALSLQNLAANNGLYLVDVIKTPMHGGSLRATFSKNKGYENTENLSKQFKLETGLGLSDSNKLLSWRNEVTQQIESIGDKVALYKSEGKKIAAFGASGRATILLNSLDISENTIDFIIDESPARIGRFMPGVNIEIVDFKMAIISEIDIFVLTAWNYENEIIAKLKKRINKPVKILKPLPELSIYTIEPE